MSFVHSAGFAYIKNLIIGVGAAIVLVGALFKIQSWPFASEMLTVGLLTETFLFLMLGVLPPHKDYYWERLYPGLDQHGDAFEGAGASTGGGSKSSFDGAELVNTIKAGNNVMVDALKNLKIDTKPLEAQQALMVTELKTTSAGVKNMGENMSALNSLKDAKFDEITKLTQGAGKFVGALNSAITSITDSLEDTKVYREQLSLLNKNLKSLNGVYGNVLAAMGGAKA